MEPELEKTYYHYRYGLFKVVAIIKSIRKEHYNLVIRILYNYKNRNILRVQHWTPYYKNWDMFVKEMTIDEYMVEVL